MSSIDSAVDQSAMNEVLARDPVLILAEARLHLANARTVNSGDVSACERLGGIIDCLLTKQTGLCCCGRMEGEHAAVTEVCPEVDGYFMPRRVAESFGFPDVHVVRANRMGM
jgi:hypothetical protein